MLGLIGVSMVVASAFGIWRNMPTVYLKKHIRKYFLSSKLENVTIRSVRKRGESFVMDIALPYNVPIEKFENHLAGIEQTTASTVKFKQLHGRLCQLQFGYAPFMERMNYRDDEPMKPLVVPLYSPFGTIDLDFTNESSCHLLCGGATRMGKTVFLRLIATHLLRSTDGNVQIIFIDNKVTDLHMFWNLPQVSIAETELEAMCALEDALAEADRRKALLKKERNCVDMIAYRKKHPESDVKPLFIIYDEFARHCHNSDIQEKMMALAETAGYLDVHLILATQRPDAKDVVKPRIKANMLTRICFSTPDEANSKIILDLPDAANLKAVKGRAIILDGFPQLVQVPFITPEQAVAVLQPYYRKDVENDYDERRENIEASEALPRDVEGSNSSAGLPRGSEAGSDYQSDTKAVEPRRADSSDSAAEGSSVPLYAQPLDDSPAVGDGSPLLRPSRPVPRRRKA